MSNRILDLALFLALICVTASAEQRVLIGYHDQISAATDIIQDNGQIHYLYQSIPVISATVDSVDEIMQNPAVQFVEQDLEDEICVQTPDWGVLRLSAPQSQGLGFRGGGKKVAVLDSGIDYNHPELSGIYAGGYDFHYRDDDPMDVHGHGTHCAGIISAADNNIGTLGMSPNIQLYAVKVLSDGGSGFHSSIAAGLDWCIQNDIDIASMSFGGSNSITKKMACDAAYAAGVLLVAAAGNNGGDVAQFFPAGYDSVMAVSATGKTDQIASWSNRGEEIEMAAPGVHIKSTIPNGAYGLKSGTSMACPHVAGAAALLWGAMPGYSNKQIRYELAFGAEDNGNPGRDPLYGYGFPGDEEYPELNDLARIELAPSYSLLPLNSRRRIRVYAYHKNGSKEIVSTRPTRCIWSSSDPTVATIDQTHAYPYILTSPTPGNAALTVTYLGLSKSIQIRSQ